MLTKNRLLIPVCSLLLFDTASYAQTPIPAMPASETGQIAELIIDRADNESAYEFSYAAPGSPVLPLIGVTGDQITRSESLRKFGLGVLNGLGGNGTGPALAVDFSPHWLLSKQSLTLQDYRQRKNGLGRVAARTKFGMALSFGDKVARRPSSFVVSASTSLLDHHDALFNDTFTKCIKTGPMLSILRQIDAAGDDNVIVDGRLAYQAQLDAFEKERPGLISKEYAACATRLGKALAAKPSLDVGAGIRYRGLPGRIKQLEKSGTIFWGTFASGTIGGATGDEGRAIPRAGPLTHLRVRGVIHARYTINEDVLSNGFVLQGKRDSAMIVAGIESAPSLDPKKIERVRWNLQAGWNTQSTVLPTDVNKDYWRYQAIVNLRISNGLWANGTLGRVSGKGVKADTKALLSFTFTPPSKASKLTEYYSSRDK